MATVINWSLGPKVSNIGGENDPSFYVPYTTLARWDVCPNTALQNIYCYVTLLAAE